MVRALERVGLLHLRDRRAGELSGGEKQRVAVARALVTDPKVLLADEPTGALDQGNSERLIALLREINAAGTTVVVVTHDPLVGNSADRQINLVDGRTQSPLVRPSVGDPRPEPVAGPVIPFSVSPWRRVGLAGSEAFAAVISRPSRSLWVMVAYALGVDGTRGRAWADELGARNGRGPAHGRRQ